MKVYPPIDPEFYRVDFQAGMSEDEIQEDWKSYCDGMSEFCAELDRQQAEAPPTPTLHPFRVLVDKILAKFGRPKPEKPVSRER